MHNKILLPHKEISGRDVELAIANTRLLLAKVSYHELSVMLGALTEPYRERVTAMLRDVLCGYPTMTFGVPVLMRVDDVGDILRPIPLPLPEYQPPDTSVAVCSWLSVRTMRSVERFGRQTEPVTILPARQECAVLLFQCRGDTPPELSDGWWGDLFRPLAGHVTMSAQELMPWPNAVEAATAMLVSSRSPSGSVDTPRRFLSLDDYVIAHDAGRQFYRRLAEQAGGRYRDIEPDDI